MKRALGSIAVAALIVGCATMAPSRNEAVAELAPTAGNNAKGTVTFSQKDRVVLVVARMSGLTPGSHGFHVHEKGDCSAADAMSAGGHFNPPMTVADAWQRGIAWREVPPYISAQIAGVCIRLRQKCRVKPS